ncbi:2OG-Fe dioxygenase family protein [Chromohalobacter sp. 48-RD10]|uniref:2OG-Fe dioxygenase family protein n=1 Tax=Chromohalobacter sp. 48-RD10 TaxID=2994063 RepID=UPI0024698B54|nr:2OG-Fe dioxygenase family protein [Chromohalobacter sp. 48-RD10]
MSTLQETTARRYSTDRVSQRLDIDDLCSGLARHNYLFLDGLTTTNILTDLHQHALSDWREFAASWGDMPLDGHMADGGSYRRRRHATLAANADSPEWHIKAHQPHYQGRDFNSLNGGIARHYEPILKDILHGATMSSIVGLGCRMFSRLAPYYPWHIELHQFRIESNAEFVGKPTPEGVHRDGVNFVIMAMVDHSNMTNAESTIYDLDQNPLKSFTLNAPLDLAIVNDEQVFHGVSPIQPSDTAAPAVRDVLIATFRKQF